jgi:hypothetical protein
MHTCLLPATLARCECLKRHGVGEQESELGADFSSLVLPKMSYHAAATAAIDKIVDTESKRYMEKYG